MGYFIGKNEFDFGALDNLPSGYVNQIKDMLVNSTIKMNRLGGLDYDIQVYKKGSEDNKDLIIGIQGGENQVQYLYYNSKRFNFTYIPMSIEQQIVFVRNMFLKYIASRITKMSFEEGLDFNISEYHMEVSPITNPLY